MSAQHEGFKYRVYTSLRLAFPLILCSLCYFGISYCLEIPNACYSEIRELLQLNEKQHLSFTKTLNILYSLPNIFLPFVLNFAMRKVKQGLRVLFLFGIGCGFVGHLLFVVGVSCTVLWPIWIGYVIFGIGSECITLCCLSYTNQMYLDSKYETLCISITTFSCDIANFSCFWFSRLISDKFNFLIACWFSVILCLISVLSVFCILIFFPVRKSLDEKEKCAVNKNKTYKALLSNRFYWMICFVYLFQNQTIYPGSMKWHEILEHRFFFSPRQSQRSISLSSLIGALIGPCTGYFLDRLISIGNEAMHLHLKCMFLTCQAMFFTLAMVFVLNVRIGSIFAFPCLIIFQISNSFFASSFWSFIGKMLQKEDSNFGYSFLSSLLNLFCILIAALCTSLIVIKKGCLLLAVYLMISLMVDSALLGFLFRM